MKIVSYLFADGFTGAPKMGAEIMRALQANLSVAVFSPAPTGGPLQDLAGAFGSQIVAAPAGKGHLGKTFSYAFGLAMTAFKSLTLAATSREFVVLYGATIFSLPLAPLSLAANVKTILPLHDLGPRRACLAPILF